MSPISVTLGDCLACSGCITSAEAVLIAEQSHDKVLQVLEEKQKGSNNMIFVVSMSLQALASLGAKYNLNIQSTAEHLSYFFHYQLGVDYIFDLSLARHICLIEYGKELMEKREQKKPILSSFCPGFVCYAEKSQGSTLVPLLSRVKSPQQIMGLLVKRRLHLVDPNRISSDQNLNCHRIYHISLMPCYDKKLEASRLENKLEPDYPEVDCVITPIEMEKILQIKQIYCLESLPTRKLDTFSKGFYNVNSQIYSHLGSGSGAYAESLLRMMVFHQNVVTDLSLFDKDALQWKVVRNADFLELSLNENGRLKTDTVESETEQQPFLSFAILNGFRNVQNLVARLKRKACHYDFVEVSACPKGCLNGGAQLRGLPFNKELNQQSQPDSDPVLITYEQVQKLYDQLPKIEFDFGVDSEKNDQIYQKLQLDVEFCRKFRTEFHEVEKKFNILNSNW